MEEEHTHTHTYSCDKTPLLYVEQGIVGLLAVQRKIIVLTVTTGNICDN